MGPESQDSRETRAREDISSQRVPGVKEHEACSKRLSCAAKVLM